MGNEVVIVDYGVGNLYSVARAVEHCRGTYRVTSDPEEVSNGAKVILPGVGAFGQGMRLLRERGLDVAVKECARRGTSFLGICLGMQMLMESSEEFGHHEGLGLIPGRVIAIPSCNADGTKQKTPHIGWSELHLVDGGRSWATTPLASLGPRAAAYFVHSFMAVPENPEHRIADCWHGNVCVAAVIGRENLCGVQFHPEKSGEVGLAVVQRFLES